MSRNSFYPIQIKYSWQRINTQILQFPYSILKIFFPFTQRGIVHRVILSVGIAILSVFLFFGGPGYYSARSFQTAWNLGHLFYFSIMVWLLTPYIAKYTKTFYSCIASIFILAIIFGAGIEVLQTRFQRTPDLGDIIRNLIGCLIGIFFLIPERRALGKSFLKIVQSVTVILVAFQIVPVAAALSDEHIARKQFPILSDFETSSQIGRWDGKTILRDDKVFLSGSHSMKVQLDKDVYSGVVLCHFQRNWQGYDKVQFDIYNPDPEILSITCRIYDSEHNGGININEDSFSRSSFLHQGWNHIEIDIEDIRFAPKSRLMDIDHIQGVFFFATQLPAPRVMYIDDVKLIRNSSRDQTL